MRDNFSGFKIGALRAAVAALNVPCADKRSRVGLLRALSGANLSPEKIAALPLCDKGAKSVNAGAALGRAKSFVAIDFETANRYRNSACAISVVRVEDGRIVDTMTRLIKPPVPYFEFTYIHGIDAADVANAPQYHEIHDDVLRMLEGAEFIAAHNASFDKSVMNALCAHWSLPTPSLPWECTVKLARRKWNLSSAKLPCVCEHLGIPLKHHDATSDATACAKIVLASET